MTPTFNLRASNNATFRWTRDFSSLAFAYGIATSIIRMQARLTAFAPDPPEYEWNSKNLSGGMAQFDAETGLCVFSAPASDMARMPPRLVYDCRLELTSGDIVPLFTGRLVFSQGVTRSAAASLPVGQWAIGDTVYAEGDPSAVVPLTMTAALAAAQGASARAISAKDEAVLAAATLQAAMGGDMVIVGADGEPGFYASSAATVFMAIGASDATGHTTFYIAESLGWPAKNRVTDATGFSVLGFAP